MRELVYIQLKKRVQASVNDSLTLEHIAHITTNSPQKQKLLKTPIYEIKKNDHDVFVIDYFIIVKHLVSLFPNHSFHLIGKPQAMIQIQKEKKSKSILFVIAVWIILFIGTAMTIINFHYDVSMQEVQQKIYYLFTGKKNKYPLLIQIPYSIGLGAGMLLFFNHWFKKKFTKEPSPLEIELHNYQKNIDDYVMGHRSNVKDD
ncbi:MAG TPA: stage V sporulation protein AA [Bacillota bacterium]|nr:stage V sporulation protein AA [Bacillota bacterium]